MTLNLDKHKDELVSGWREVVDCKSPTNWALFSYVGQSYDLNLVGKGEGGLDELENELNSGKIMYALCKVYVPEKNAEKIVLINWQGEGAPLAFKGTCANHVSTIKSFFKGVQISINARTEDDVEPSFIISTVAKAIAGEGIRSSSIDCESDGKIGPVGTAYKRINPLDEINTQAKDDFWRKQQEEELYRKKEEQTKLRKFSQNDVMVLRQESQEYFNTAEEQQKEHQNHNHGKDHSPIVNNTTPKQMNGNGNVSPVSPQILNMSSRDARLATTPKKNLSNESSNLVRQRIKSFDGTGASIPMPKSPLNPSSTSNNFTNINRNIRITPTSNFGKSNGLTPPNSGDSRSKSPLSPNNGVVRSSSPCSTASTASNAESHDHDESDSGLSVSKRRQMFENGGFQSASNNYIRQNPQEEIKKEREKTKIVPNPVFTTTTSATTPSKKEEPVAVTSPPPPKATNYSYSNNTTNNSSNNKAQITSPTPPATTTPDIKKSLSPKNEIIPQKSPVFEEESSPIPAKTGNGYHGYNYINNIGQHQLQDAYELEDGEIIDDTLNDTFDEHDGVDQDQEFGGNHEAGGVVDNNYTDIVAQSPELVGLEDRIIPGGSLKRFEITEEMGLCARALYDYQAEDDTEISFDPSDIITNIEKIDDGWWQGKNSSEMFGLFPSNYVELLN